MKPYLLTLIAIITILFLTKLPNTIGGSTEYVDLSGNKVSELTNVTSIISLSPIHTENISFINGDNLLVGVSEDSIFPYETTKLKKYNIDKLNDVEEILENPPDLILIDPSILKKSRSSISKFESAGIKVINIEPKNLDGFDSYIRILGLLTGRIREAEHQLLVFNTTLRKLKKIADSIENRKTGFIELSERGYFTATENSLISEIFEYAGVDLIIPEKNWFSSDSETQKVGFDFIKENNRLIDTYFTLSGLGFSGASKVSILQNQKYKSIDSIKRGDLFELSPALIGQYTFRMLDGIREITRLSYSSSNRFSDIEPKIYEGMNRITLAKLLFNELNLQIYTVIDPVYYEWERFSHTYGGFSDLFFTDEDFNIIETVSNKLYIKPMLDSTGREVFNRSALITKEDIEYLRMIISD